MRKAKEKPGRNEVYKRPDAWNEEKRQGDKAVNANGMTAKMLEKRGMKRCFFI